MIQIVSHVALGGALGACLRYFTTLAALRFLGAGFPIGTLALNVLGSLFMGLLAGALARRGALHLAPFFMSGLLGSFTTFSAFSLDALMLWERGQPVLAFLYVLASVILSLAAVAGGIALARGGIL